MISAINRIGLEIFWNKNIGFANIKAHLAGDFIANVFGTTSPNNAKKRYIIHNNTIKYIIGCFAEARIKIAIANELNKVHPKDSVDIRVGLSFSLIK